MGLLPLEFSDCLLDSPYFRENLRAHERQLERASEDVKCVARCVREVAEAARSLSAAKRALAAALEAASASFECGGLSGSGGGGGGGANNGLTDDEVIIANSLREFASFFNQVEDESDRMLENAQEKFLDPLERFRKEQVGQVRQARKDFEKRTARCCAAQDRHANTSWRREESLAEAAEAARVERRRLEAASLQYVYLVHVVQERRRFEFVEAVLAFMQSWANYHRHGSAVTTDFSPYLSDLHSRVQRTRDNFSATVEHFGSLKERTLERRAEVDPGTINRMYARQGYLYRRKERGGGGGGGGGTGGSGAGVGAAIMSSVSAGVSAMGVQQQWGKCYAQYRAQGRALTIIDYSQQGSGRIASTEEVRVTECACAEPSDSSGAADNKFRFIVSGEDSETGSMVTLTFQAMSDFERKKWVEAMGGTWPAVSTLQRIRADSVEDNLNSSAFLFLKDCLAELEARGLKEQGLYRVGGVVSKVRRLLTAGLLEQSGPPPDLTDPKQWESKTIASAVKQYFRDLSKPLMTHQLYPAFLEAAKGKDEEARAAEIASVVRRMPRASREMLRVLARHLSKVAANSDVNLMTPANLGVCFGPTLLRPREETVASIMDIKFCNEVVEVIVERCSSIFPEGDSSPEIPPSASSTFQRRKHSSSANSAVSVATTAASVPSRGGEDTPDRAVRGGSTPQRTSSFGSFSQLSTNSLPDFKDYGGRNGSGGRPMALASSTPCNNANSSNSSSNGDRPRSKSHQVQTDPASRLEVPPLPRKQASLPSPPCNGRIILEEPQQQHHQQPQQQRPSTTSRLQSMKSSQDDLMASLEMMNLLAADLPSKVTLSQSPSSRPSSRGSPLKRSYTLGASRGSNSYSGSSTTGSTSPPVVDTFRQKPPLPRLSLTSPGTTQASPTQQNPTPTFTSSFFLRSNPSPSPSLSSNSGESAAASPRVQQRTQQQQAGSDLLARMQEKLQSRSRRGSVDYSNGGGIGAGLSPVMTTSAGPAVPIRKYRRVIVSPSALQEHQSKVAVASKSSSRDILETSPSPSARRKELAKEAEVEEVSAAPPSPPTDSGLADSPPFKAEVSTKMKEEEDIQEDEVKVKDEEDEEEVASTVSSSVLLSAEESEGEEEDKAPDERNSRYDNVQQRQTRGEDGDDEATTGEEEEEEERRSRKRSVSTSNSDSTRLTAERREGGPRSSQDREAEETEDETVELRRGGRNQAQQQQHPDIVPRVKAFPVTESDYSNCAQTRPPQTEAETVHVQRKRMNRVSGPYDNVRVEGGAARDDQEVTCIKEEDDDQVSLDSYGGASSEGMTSLRRMLAVGQTSDV